ncbi:MAG TPA: MFS transporter [Kaistia sp.]|jgi:MFS family permease|nr:MFS transporter [Kaistia sp.]
MKNRTNHRWATQAALAGAMLLASLGTSITSVALPTLSRAFSAPLSSIQWVVLAYLIAATVAIVLAGRLGDMFGHRQVLLAGLILFAIASVACATAPTLGVLIAARAAQGVGGAILMAMPMSIARDAVKKEQLGAAMGLLGTMSAVGTALGPSLGGVLVAALGWRAVFLPLAGIAVLVLGLVLIAISPPAARVGKVGASLDWPGAALLAFSLTAYSLATAGGRAGVAGTPSLYLLIAVIGLALFVRIETRTSAPLVSVAMLRKREISASLAMNGIASTAMMSTLIVGPFFLAFGLHLNAAAVGLVMAVGPVTSAFAGIPAGRLTDRFGAPRMLVAGLAQMTIGLVSLALLPLAFGIAGYAVALVLLTPGYQLFLAANNTSAMLFAPDQQRGMLSGFLGLSRNLGFMTGASVMATLFAGLVGIEPIGNAPADGIGHAFAATFVVAAGMTSVALLLAVWIWAKPAAAKQAAT